MFAITAAQTLMLSTAADRLISVIIPIKYNHLKIRSYLFVHTLLAVVSGVWMSINALNLSNTYPNILVTGYVGDLFIYDMTIMFKYIMVLSAINVALYIFVWIVVRYFHPGKT